MKKLVIYTIMLGLMLSCVIAATVTRNMPSTIEPGKELAVTFNVAEMEVGKSVTISDIIPSQFSLKEWSVTGANKENVVYEVKGKEYRWEIPATATTVKLTYKIDVPASAAGSYSFEGVYFAPPAKMDELKGTLNVAKETPAPAIQPPPTSPQEEIKEVWKKEPETNYGIAIAVAVVVLVVIAGIVLFVRKKKH